MTNAVPVDKLFLSFRDASKELSSSTINVTQFVDNAAWLSALTAYKAGLAPIIDGVIASQSQTLVTRLDNAVPSDGFRELKALIRYEDNTTKDIYTNTIPTINPALARVGESDFIDLTVGDVPAFVVAFEAMAISPAGNGVTVVSMEYVGRNL